MSPKTRSEVCLSPATLAEPAHRWLLMAWTTFEVLGLWLIGCVLIAACIGLGYALFELLTWL
jgi:hypothetical protein